MCIEITIIQVTRFKSLFGIYIYIYIYIYNVINMVIRIVNINLLFNLSLLKDKQTQSVQLSVDVVCYYSTYP